MFIINPIARTIISEVVIIFGVNPAPSGSTATNNSIYRYNGSTVTKEAQRIVSGGTSTISTSPYSLTGAGLNNVAYLFGAAANFNIVTYDGYNVSESFTVPGFVTSGVEAVSAGSNIVIVGVATGLNTTPGYLFNGSSITAFTGIIGSSSSSTSGAACAYLPNNNMVFTFGGRSIAQNTTVAAHNQIYYLAAGGLYTGTANDTLSPARLASTAKPINDFTIKIFGGYQFQGTGSTYTLFNTIESYNGTSRSTDAQTLPFGMYSQSSSKMGNNIMLFGGDTTTSVGLPLSAFIMRYNGSSISTETVSLPYGISKGSPAINLNLPNGTA